MRRVGLIEPEVEKKPEQKPAPVEKSSKGNSDNKSEKTKKTKLDL